MGGRNTEGERNPQLLSGPIKSSSSTFCWGAEDVINSEAEGVLGLNGASAGSFAWAMTSLFLEHEAREQVKDLPPPGTRSKGAGQSPGFHFTPKHDNHTMQMCASFQSFSLRGHMI